MIVFDNVTFSNQRAGGVPSLAANIISRVIESRKYDYRLVEDDNAMNNIFRIMINAPESNVLKQSTFFFRLKRYMDIRLKLEGEFVYQSSYYRICKNRNAKNLVIVYDFMYELFEKRCLALKVHQWQKYRAIRRADVVVCISDSTRKDLFKYVPDTDPTKVEVIHIGVSKEYRPLENKLKEYGEYVLVVGGRGGYKNFGLTVDAVSRTNLKLMICGGALNETERKLLDEKLGTESYLYVGVKPNEELNQLYNSVYCLAYPSSYEGFGIPVIEAQSAGCPVIAYNASSIPEIIGDTPLLMQSLSVVEFVEKLELLKSADLRDKVIKNGLENCRRFDWQKIVSQYMSIYDRLLEK